MAITYEQYLDLLKKPGIARANPLLALPPQELFNKYLTCASIHEAAEAYGVCGETLRQYFLKHGFRLRSSKWTDAEKQRVKDYYSTTPDETFRPQELAIELQRPYYGICLMASRLGISRQRDDPRKRREDTSNKLSESQKQRFEDPEIRQQVSEQFKEWHATHPHPKGFLGKNHGQEAKDAIAAAHKGKKIPRERTIRQMATRIARYGTLAPPHKRGSWRAAWVEVGGKRFYARSAWEVKYAKYLEVLKKGGAIVDWEYEPETFWFDKVKRGVTNYTPDFRITNNDGTKEYHEVKGWMDSKSRTKINRMRIYHNIKVVLRDGAWFKANKGMLSAL